MSYLAALGMIVAATTGAPVATHNVVVPHPSGPVDTEYRGRLSVEHRQVGAAGPGGRASTLRCLWTAHLAVDRTASHSSGIMASRSFVHEGVARGQRPGWCSTNRVAIERDVAARTQTLDRHVAEAARADRPALHAEIDRLHAHNQAG